MDDRAAKRGFKGYEALVREQYKVQATAQPPVEETAFQQALREFPTDVKEAFAPKRLVENAQFIGKSLKHGLFGDEEK